MNNEELLEAMKRQQQHTLMEIHLSAEDTKEHFDNKIGKIEVRVTKLEHFRTWVKATAAAFISIPTIAGVVNFLSKTWHGGKP